ncbi:MAG TPA: PAS domain S-box protein, partial [Flavobacteriaceae bacterium]|nr:PAS domain S-box protein [Flavobacteriaceae bacterium]
MKIQKNFEKDFNVFDSQSSKYEIFFDSAPIALWIEDFSRAKEYIEDIAANHKTTPKNYLKNNPEVIYQLTPLVKVVDVNQTAVTMHKANSKQELLSNLDKIFTQDSNNKFAELLLEFFLGVKEVEAETINTTIDGEEFNISLKFNVIDEKSEHSHLLIVSVENITDKVKVREALFESEKQYKEAQELAKIGSWYYDFDTKKLTWSYESYLILDLDPNKTYDLNLDFYLSFVHPEDKEKVQNFSFESLLANRNQRLQYRLITNKNNLKYIQEKRTVVLEEGRVKKIIGIAQDITENVVARKKLDTTKKTLLNTLTGINDGLVILNQNDKFIHVNERAEEILGFESKKLLGNSIWSLFKDRKNDPFAKCYTKTKKTNEAQTVEDYFETWDKWFETRMVASQNEILIFFQETTEKRKTENKIKTAYNIINKSSAVAFLCKNAYDFPIEFASENTFDLFEYPYTDFLENKIKIFDVVYEEDLPYIRENVFRLLKEDSFDDLDTKPFRIVTKSGKIKWIEVTFEIIRNKKDEITHLQGIATDVTERKLEQELLFKNTQHLVDQFNNTPLASVIWDLDFKVKDWNKSAERIFGYTKEEAVGKHVKDIIIPSDFKDKIDEVWSTILTYPGGHTNTNRNITKEGKTIICDWYNVTLKDSEGNVTGVASLSEDITEKTKAKLRLEKSEKKYKDIFEKSTDPVFILKNYYITDGNQAALALFGYKNKEEILNVLPSEISPLEQPNGELSEELAKTQIKEALVKGSNKFEWYHKKRNGDVFPCEVSLTYIEDVEGEDTLHAVVRDISRRVKEELLREVLFNISNISLKSDNFQEYGNYVKNQLNNIIDTTNFFIALLSNEPGMLKTSYISDKYENLSSFPIEGSYTGYVIRRKKPLLINNSNHQQLIEEGKVKMIGQPSKSWLGVPLSFNDRIFGAIVIQSYTDENAYTKSDLKLLEFV